MPANAFRTALDPPAQVSDGGPSAQQVSPASAPIGAPTALVELTSGLRLIDDELQALAAQLQAGEPRPPELSLRRRIGFRIKRRLYGFLWWHMHHVRKLTALLIQRNHEELKTLNEELKTLNALSQTLDDAVRQHRDTRQALAIYKRESTENEIRWRQLISAQSSVQAALAQQERRHTDLDTKLSAAQALIDDLNRSRENYRAENQHLLDRIGQIEQSMNDSVANLLQRIDAKGQPGQHLATQVSELGLLMHQTRTSLSIQDRRLGLFLEEARKRFPIAPEQIHAMADKHSAHQYDLLYAGFEDVFRGTREDIKQRLTRHLELLKEHKTSPQSNLILDLGCGRGEWLDLLREHGFGACGVDTNEGMVAFCRSLGLQVVQQDALSYLASMQDASLGVVTAFHLVEHLPFDLVMSLIDQSLRALKPGGLLILETPNPQNLQVSTHTFYLDPTHRHPLPSAMLRFFVEARGFCDVRILELHPYPESLRIPDDGTILADRFNQYFYGPQDYAVIGRRP